MKNFVNGKRRVIIFELAEKSDMTLCQKFEMTEKIRRHSVQTCQQSSIELPLQNKPKAFTTRFGLSVSV